MTSLRLERDQNGNSVSVSVFEIVMSIEVGIIAACHLFSRFPR